MGERDFIKDTGHNGASLGLLVPSRGRPGNIRRLVQALQQTGADLTQLHVGIDEDDPSRAEYEENWDQTDYPYALHVRRGLRQVVAWCNELADLNAATYPFLGHVNDDNVPQTRGWDHLVIASLSRRRQRLGYGFCFGNDRHPGRPAGSLACHIFMTANVVEALGYMACPRLRHMYVDDIWTAWGRATSMDFLSDVTIAHLHPTARPDVLQDDTYRAAAACFPYDETAYREYVSAPVNGLQSDLAKIRALSTIGCRSSGSH